MSTLRPLEILVVCTANVCRSPMAAHFIGAAASEAGSEVVVSSSGFMLDGDPATPEVVAVMNERGADLSTHRSRITTVEMLDAADLVVTMERRHGRDLTLLAPTRSQRIHTLGGLVEALENLDEPALAATARLDRIVVGRPASDLLGEGPDEIADPFGRGRRVNRKTADQLQALSTRLIAGLFGGEGEGD